MPMSAAERQCALDRIGVLLEQDIQGRLQEFYAAAVALTERQPDQVNNEVRNAVTHMARALSASSRDKADEDLKKAEAHVERAMRDCIKLSVIELHDRIQGSLRQIEVQRGTIDPALIVRRNALTSQRQKVFKDETDGHPIVDDFVSLFNDASAFEQELADSFQLSAAKISSFQLWRVKAKRAFGEIFLGVVAGIIGGMLLALLIPDLTNFGNQAQIYLHIRKSEASRVPKVPAASSPPPAKAARPNSPMPVAGAVKTASQTGSGL